MEDQPADTGDLTTGAAPAATSDPAAAPAATPRGKTARNRHRLPRVMAHTVVAEPEAAEEVSEPQAAEELVETAAGDLSETAAEDVSDDAEATPAEPEPVLVAHRPAGRALRIAAIVAAALFVGAGAFAGATAKPYLVDRAREAEKFEVAQTAAAAITSLWTYAPDNIDKLPDRAAKFLAGDFANEYKTFIDAIVAPNKQAQVTNETQVVGAAVESLTPTEATAIVYTNSVTKSPATKDIPSLRYLSYRLTMVPQDGRWLITKMSTVTKLDLTPRV